MRKVLVYSIVLQSLLFANTRLETSIISTTGFEDTLANEVRNVNVITKDDIQKRGYKSLRDLFKNTPSVYMSKKAFGDVIDMRGQGEKANTNVQIMINGVAMNMTDSSHTSMPFDAINVDDIERIEILPGGGSVLYGSGTQGGVINIITKKTRQDFYANIASRYQSGGSINARFNIGAMATDRLFLRASVLKDKSNGYRYGEKSNGAYGSFGLDYQLGDNQNLSLDFSHYSGDQTVAGGVSKKELDKNRRVTDGEYSTTDIKMTNLNLGYGIKFNDSWQFNTAPFYQKTKFQPKGTISGFEDKKIGARNKVKYNYESGNLIFGYDFIYNKGINDGHFDYIIPMPSPMPPMRYVSTSKGSTKKITNSFFIQNLFEMTDSFSLTTGYRFDHASYKITKYTSTKMAPLPAFPTAPFKVATLDLKKSENNHAFEITPSFAYSDTGNLYFKFERGFTSPSANKMQNKDRVKGYYPSNIKSEKFITYEVGMRDLVLEQFFQATAFYTKSKDEITTDMVGMGEQWKQYNIGKTEKWGLEIGLEQSLIADKLKLQESFAYTNTEVKDAGKNRWIKVGEVVPNVPKYKFTLGADFEIINNLNIFSDITLYGSQKNSSYEKISSYSLTDIGVRFKYKGFSLTAGINNLFDKEFYNSVSGKGDDKIYSVGDGRTYYTEFKYDF